MLLSALAVALLCACAAAHVPLSAAGDDNDCALYLTGPGRTSAYDYSLNLLRGNFNYEGQHTCITYDAINHAYVEARKRILVSQPKGDWTAEDFASVGELVLDISINLAKTYGLTYGEIEKGLPLIDTSLTRIREVCPPVFSHVECRAGKYRRLDGLCNNLEHPTWGATMAPFQRLIGPLFADGINAPRIAHSGRDLPLSRVVSRTMHPDEGFHDHAGTVMVIAWGQFIDHDYTLTGTPLDPRNRNDPEECCKRPQHLKHPYCNEIRIPDDDYFYRLFGVKCIDFVRGFPSPRPGCRLGSRVPFNTLTGALDGNTVYGVTEKFARKLRTGFGGLLRMNPVFKEYGLKDLLPLKLDIPDEGCTRPNKNMYCFEAGEIRVNEQLVLTVMHTLMAREHNRVANGLAAVNPHWDDETLYQEARRINVAEIQHITYNEFLPILLGKDVMEKFGLILQKEGYWEGYDPNVNPDVIAGFASAAYRFGHSLLPTAVERWSKAHKFIASKRLSDLIRRPYDLYRAGVLDEYVMGLMNQVAQAMDDSITQEVTNHLFKKVGARFGMDLVSFNMQRGREFGIPGYMEYRKFCGLSGADTFQDLFGTMPNETVRKYETIFEHPVDVDLWSGGVSERPLPGSMLGPTFACVIATQFSYSRRGDRFWYELPHQPSSFTPEQLKEVRKARLARVICDNTDIIDTTQLYPMVLPDHELNPRVPCRSGIIPSIDFSKWAETRPFAGPAKQFITIAEIQEKSETNKTAENHAENDALIKAEEMKNTLLINNTDTNVIINTNTTGENKTVVDTETILKYVYKENEKKEQEKTKGHVKNSLLRRKRLTFDSLGPSNAPLIVNYETSHQPHHAHFRQPYQTHHIQPYQIHQAQISNPTEGNPDKFIKKSNLARFSLETLHDEIVNSNTRHREEPNKNDEKKIENEKVPPLRSQESTESDENISDTSREVDDEKSSLIKPEESVSKYDRTNQESGERDRPSNDNNDDSDHKSNRKPISNENIQSSETENDLPGQTQGNSGDVVSKENYRNTERSSDRDSNEGGETDTDTSSEYSSHKKRHRKNNEKDEKLPIKIQDVDLDDFSNEKLKLNKHGRVEPIIEDPDNNNQDSSAEHNPRENSKYKQQQNNNDDVKPIIEIGSNSESIESNEEIEVDKAHTSPDKKGHISEYYKKPNNYVDGVLKPFIEIVPNSDTVESSEEENPRDANKAGDNSEYRDHPKNNVDEVKPVIEIGADSESTESDEEQEELKPQKQSPDDDDENVEAFRDSASGRKAGIIANLNQNNDNVKQEFERIPRNYNHDNSKTGKKTSEKEDAAETDDVPPARDGHYDDNLNFKFDDVPLHLPEVKLPEDVLAYNRKDPKKPEEQDHNSNEQEEEEEEDEESSKNTNGNENESAEDSYEHVHDNYDYKSSPFKKEHPKGKSYANKYYNQHDDDVDLYEKFVAERFGKRDTFKKRSQKLQELRFEPTNPELYEQVGKILKKTKQTTMEAAKSGDPNAGYAWTLEYGQKLV